jgi:acyl-CoA reductase-like NAD-dependent aldehyde dehydrogenase
MTTVASDELVCTNPATGADLGRVPVTSTESVREHIQCANQAQMAWAETSWHERRRSLRRWWRILARDADSIAGLIRAEVGKPSSEAMAEVVATLDALRWTVQNAERVLAGERIGAGWQCTLLIQSARLRWRPFGVVGIVGTWNYPWLLNAPVIAQALAAGNVVVWKPSELASWCGRRLQESLEEAGFSPGLVTTVFGGPTVGQALTEAPIDKGVFTGGIVAGRRVLGALASRGVPAVAELSGFDPAVVLPDAPFEPTAHALTWGAFVGAGQTCVAIKRIYLVGGLGDWPDRLAELAQSLRVGDPAELSVDIGPLISFAARDRFDASIRTAAAAGARILSGGSAIPGAGSFYAPTVLLADDPAPEAALAGCFGPVIILRAVEDVDAAIVAANASPFGLAASVWGTDRWSLRYVANRLQAGMVAINDAVAPLAHAAAPFGGTKASGYGRTRGALGLREFARPQTLHARRPGGPRPQLFPYSDRLEQILAIYRRLFHPRG